MFQHAVVTGAASGLGRALCLELAQRGAAVVVSDVNAEGAEETAEEVRRRGARAEVIDCDVADEASVNALHEEAEGRIGPIDLLCNNAGVAVAGPFEELSLEDWKWIVDINLWGVIYGCRAFLPGMRTRGHGYVLNVASAAGLLRSPNMAPYNVTKIGVVGLSETLHAEYAEYGVNVTALCPTFFQTAIMDSSRGVEMAESKMARSRMKRSKVQAPDVARIALDDLVAGKVYSVPMTDGRVLWALKRAAPEHFYGLLNRAAKWATRFS
ncbi:MAG: SDR family NAD(P)-dependent oxidoreductase [Myxococcota bacterium]